MPEQFTIMAQERQITGKRVRILRAQGLTPANISGAAKPSVAIQLPASELIGLLKRHGAGVLRIHIGASANAETAILSRIERNPISSAVLHVDFRRVLLDQVMRSHVPIHFIGEAPAVKVNGGMLLHLLDTVEIESLPGNIPEAVTLDISSLEEMNSILTVADIQVPANVKIMTSASEPVVTVKAPRIEVVEAEAPAAVAATEAIPVQEEAGGESASEA